MLRVSRPSESGPYPPSFRPPDCRGRLSRSLTDSRENPRSSEPSGSPHASPLHPSSCEQAAAGSSARKFPQLALRLRFPVYQLLPAIANSTGSAGRCDCSWASTVRQAPANPSLTGDVLASALLPRHPSPAPATAGFLLGLALPIGEGQSKSKCRPVRGFRGLAAAAHVSGDFSRPGSGGRRWAPPGRACSGTILISLTCVSSTSSMRTIAW